MCKGYVYMITNLINDRKYIGVSTKCNEKNKKEYFGSGIAIKDAIKKYGKTNFVKKIIQEFDDEIKARNFERELIEQLGAIDDGLYYNLVAGGYGGAVKGRILSEETKKKISKTLKGHKGHQHDIEHIEKMKKIMTGRPSPMKGREQTESAKSKISEKLKERWKTKPVIYHGHKQKVVQCPYCDKSGGEGLMKRYHFDNCKNK